MTAKKVDSTRVVTLSILLLATILCALIGSPNVQNTTTSNCQLVPSTSIATDRKITLNMSGCAGVQRFQVSESPDFKSPAKVSVNISNMAADSSYADLSIQYEGGVPGGQGIPYSIPTETKTVRALTVVFTYEDENGEIPGIGTYETPLWAHRLIFGDGVIGYDGYYKKNSYKDHLFQSTNGRVILTGQTYPKVLRLPLERFRSFLSQREIGFKEAIYQAILADDPNFFNNNSFDFLFGLSSSTYAVRRGIYQLSPGTVVFAAPVDREKSILDDPITEVRTSFDALTVVPRYNPQTVSGVWLESDSNMTGTNYFTGGTIGNYKDGSQNFYIKLGTALPTTNARVRMSYAAKIGDVVDSSFPDRESCRNSWTKVLFHETYHVISDLPQMEYFTSHDGIGDFYYTPAVVNSYDLMSGGGYPEVHPLEGQSVYHPPQLNSFHKLALGYLQPYALNYGQNEDVIRLNRLSFSDINQLRSGITAIKVPLRKHGDPGLATKNAGDYMSENGPTTSKQSNRQYSGEEYLLLEIRNRSNLANDVFNFDKGVLSEGLVAYHVIQTEPYSGTTHTNEIVEIIDATPVSGGIITNSSASPAAFGHESQVYQFNVPEFWQEKPINNDTHSLHHMLSEGRGTKTLYVRYADASGQIIGSSQVSLTLDDDKVAANRLPQITSLRIEEGYNSVYSKRLITDYTLPNGMRSYRVTLDDRILSHSNPSGTGQEVFFINPQLITTGNHTFTVTFFDEAFIETTASINFSAGTAQTLGAPNSLTATLNGDSLILNWATPDGAMSNLESYLVYKNNVLLAELNRYYVPSYWDYSIDPGATYQYRVVAKSIDGTLTASSNTVSVTIPGGDTPPTPTPTPPPPPNQAPSAVINSSATSGFAPLAINFSALGSIDPDGSIVSYNWNFGDGTSGTGVSVSKTYNTPGSYTVTLTVTDNNGATATKSLSIVVSQAPDTTKPQITAFAPANGTLVKIRSTVTVSASATDNVGVSKIEFFVNGTLLCSDVASPYSCSWKVPNTVGKIYTLLAKAYDAAGNFATQQVQVTSRK